MPTAAKMVEDGMGYRTKKVEQNELSTYQKWLSLKAEVEKKVRVFLGVDKTEEIVQKRIAEKKAAEEKKQAEVKKLRDTLPSFVDTENDKQLEELNRAAQDWANAAATKVVEQARPADPKLPKDQAGVAYMDLVEKKKEKNKIVEIKIKDIPKLNIGREARISANDFLANTTKVNLAEQKIQKLNTPNMYSQKELDSWLTYQLEPVNYVKQELKTLKALGLKKDIIENIVWATRKGVEVQELALDILSEEEERLLQALILDDQNSCHSAVGLYYPLVNSKNKVVEKTSSFRMAKCNHKMGFFHASVENLLDVINNESMSLEARKDAFNLLVKDLPYEHEITVGKRFLSRPTKGVQEMNENAFYYYITKAMLRTKNFAKALEYAVKVQQDKKYYPKAQYAAAISEHLLGNPSASLSRQRKLLAYLEDNRLKKDNVYGLTKLNLARYAFQNKKMNESIKHYREIDRSHTLWMDSLKELGWAQLINGDEPGAIGNMHSLHTPFFKKVFQPETFAIRSIGYLNLCHYGDAYRSLSNLEEQYRGMLGQIQTYQNKYKSKSENYKTAKTFLKQGKGNVRGLDDKIIRNAVRKKAFLNRQEHINRIYEEKEQYKFIKNFVKRDARRLSTAMKKNEKRIKEYKAKVKLAETNKKYYKNLIQWSQALEYASAMQSFYLFKKDILKESIDMYKTIQSRAFAELDKIKRQKQLEAGDLIRDELAEMQAALKSLFRNNEFLRYEVFAGAGENIRFHVAGRDLEAKRLPASAKPQTKDLKWNYDGEFWQDEVGYYRSTLKSNCPKR
tara:strand:- start:11419 stop:13797 length:2379 start_codon:yes stop_codon:yes gene_type:complete